MTKPITPDDINRRGIALTPSDYLIRAGAVTLRAGLTRSKPIDLVRNMYPDERDGGVTELILRTASTPATVSGTTAWAGALARIALIDFIVSLAPVSAAASLIARSLQIPLGNSASVVIPSYLTSAADAGAFIKEGAAIPVRQMALSSGVNIQMHKLATISTFTRELAEASNIENVVRAILGEAVGLALDAALFSTDVGDETKPSGLLYGVVPIAATSGYTLQTVSTDIENLIDALSTSGGGRDPVIIAAPSTAAKLKIWTTPKFDIPILASSAIAKGTLVAVEASALATIFNAVPQFSISAGGTVHIEADTPAEIVGATGTPAAPVRSLYQTDSLALKCVLRCGWSLRGSGLVAEITGVNW